MSWNICSGHLCVGSLKVKVTKAPPPGRTKWGFSAPHATPGRLAPPRGRARWRGYDVFTRPALRPSLTAVAAVYKWGGHLSLSNYYKAQNTWETTRISESEQYEELVTPRNNTHTWFSKSSYIIRMEPPQAIITRQT